MSAANTTTEREERILVCLSSSPSNHKVIAAAAKMAVAFRAALTAIYVKPSDYDALPAEDKARLQSNIRLAEQVMAHSLEHGRTWLNERDLRQELMQRIERTEGEERFTLLRQLERGELSVPDGGYYEDGQLYTVEIYNENYTAEILAAKDLCAQTLGASLRLVRQ